MASLEETALTMLPWQRHHVNLPGAGATLGALGGGRLTGRERQPEHGSLGPLERLTLSKTQAKAKGVMTSRSPQGQHCCPLLVPGSFGSWEVWIQSRLWGRGQFIQASVPPRMSLSGKLATLPGGAG